MKRVLTAAVAASFGLLGWVGLSSVSSATTGPVTSPPLLKVMPLGDSITAGYQSSSGAGYRLPLWNEAASQSRYRMDFVGTVQGGAVQDPDNEGHGGTMIDDIRGQIDGYVTKDQPDVVLLHLGINDLDRGTDKAHAGDRMTALIDQIFADRPGVAVIVQGLLPTTPSVDSSLIASYNAQLAQLQPTEQAAGHKYRYVAGPSLSAGQFADGLHPNDQGYARMAQTYYQALDSAFTDGLATPIPVHHAGTESGSGRVRFADWDGDGRADYIVVNDDGSVHVYLNRGGDGHGGWLDDGVVATGLTTDKSRVRFADWDGDGRADYIAINPDGKIHVMLNRGGAGHGGWQDAGIVAQGTTTNPDQVRFADIDGDGKTDYVTIADDGIVSAYLNRGGDTGGGWVADGQIATGVTTDRSRVRLADIDGDGRADYVVLNPDGSVTAYANNGGAGHGGWTLRPKIASGVTTDQSLVDFADLNGDGLADYLVTNGPTHAFINNGGEDVRNPGWIDWGQIATGV
ncbi:FG-GAP-like repeat-containing protein [Kitasatospora sp. HPMI-4]|uniref:FG-GAP-like repeat-containing protein n=1 Tax=Kitasatospora sp. HPMI-4 TaxID=3448443 RepID=UPI003F1D50BE